MEAVEFLHSYRKRPTEIPAGLVSHEGGAEARRLRWQAAKELYWCADIHDLAIARHLLVEAVKANPPR